jgi:hypothetical protein
MPNIGDTVQYVTPDGVSHWASVQNVVVLSPGGPGSSGGILNLHVMVSGDTRTFDVAMVPEDEVNLANPNTWHTFPQGGTETPLTVVTKEDKSELQPIADSFSSP